MAGVWMKVVVVVSSRRMRVWVRVIGGDGVIVRVMDLVVVVMSAV